jgi:hypothetical protein
MTVTPTHPMTAETRGSGLGGFLSQLLSNRERFFA